MTNSKEQQKKERKSQAAAARRAQTRRRARVKVVAVLGVMALIVLGLGSFLLNGGSSSTKTTTTTAAAAAAACPEADGSSPRTITFASAPSSCIDAAKTYTATFDTTEGTIVVALDTKKTPNTVNNFVVLARYHYYDNTKIFRTDTSIDIIQAGSPHSEDASDSGPGYTIKDEGTGFKYTAGDLVMARSQGSNSGAAQFFFGTGPNVAQLDGQGTYVTFGHASQGVDVLQKIIGLNVADTSGSGLGGAPSHTVTIKTVKITES